MSPREAERIGALRRGDQRSPLATLMPWLMLDVAGMGLMLLGILPLTGTALPGLPAEDPGQLPWILFGAGLVMVLGAGAGIVVSMRKLAAQATGQARR